MPLPVDQRRDDQPTKLTQRLKLAQLVGPPPPLFSWERPAWALHLVGYLIPPKARHEMFLPSFLDIYASHVADVGGAKSILVRMALLARFLAWDLLLIRECYRHPFRWQQKE